MIRHIVILLFQKNEPKDYFELLEKTKPLITQIPGVLSYKIFHNKSHYIPEDTYSIGVEILFESDKALEVFMTHPNHYEANKLFEDYLSDYMVLTHEM